MFLQKKRFYLITAVIIICNLHAAHGQGSLRHLALDAVATTDLANNTKNNFFSGDVIRYKVTFSSARSAVVFVRGEVTFAGNLKESLVLQYETVKAGDYMIFWDSIVPEGATGTAMVTINFLAVPGGIKRASASFTVQEDPSPSAGESVYIGSLLCMACHLGTHEDIVEAFKDSGHPFALTLLSDDAPIYPDFSPAVPEPPPAFTWDNILYVIGGYAWKANFSNQDGYVLTTGVDQGNVQYNLPSTVLDTQGQFVSYEGEQTESKSFDCGPCHTTGYNQAGNQGDLATIVGTWHEEGVGCEACHGPGSQHQRNPERIKPAQDPAESCRNCHIREDLSAIEAADGFILHNQQSEELAAGGMSFLNCVTCHDAHASTHFDDQAKGTGRKIYQNEGCLNCHPDQTIGLGMQNLKCVDCHMPYAVRSGSSISFKDADGLSLRLGDMRSHLFSINREAESPSAMFSPDGARVALGSNGRAVGLTLDFVCLRCHRQAGLAQRAYTFEQVKGFAGSIH